MRPSSVANNSHHPIRCPSTRTDLHRNEGCCSSSMTLTEAPGLDLLGSGLIADKRLGTAVPRRPFHESCVQLFASECFHDALTSHLLHATICFYHDFTIYAHNSMAFHSRSGTCSLTRRAVLYQAPAVRTTIPVEIEATE